MQNHISLRQNGQLSDLANLISRELFEQYQYRLNYAEDIDLGIRLIKDGYKLAFLGTTRIIHSHNRPAYYFLKRGYVDNQFLSDIFSDFEVPKLHIESFVPDIAFVFRFLAELTEKLTTVPFPISPDFSPALLKINSANNSQESILKIYLKHPQHILTQKRSAFSKPSSGSMALP